GGTAEPPTTTSRRWEMSWGFCSRYCSRPCHTVGTAAANVGFSAARILAIGSGCRNRSGMTSEAPDMNAAYGRPQLIAWNCGTMASVLSRWDSAMPSVMQTCIECSQIDRCEYTTPFGSPVVPDV